MGQELERSARATQIARFGRRARDQGDDWGTTITAALRVSASGRRPRSATSGGTAIRAPAPARSAWGPAAGDAGAAPR